MCRAEVEEAQNSRSGADLEPNVSCAVLSEIMRYLPNGAESHLARETQKRAECRFALPTRQNLQISLLSEISLIITKNDYIYSSVSSVFIPYPCTEEAPIQHKPVL